VAKVYLQGTAQPPRPVQAWAIRLQGTGPAKKHRLSLTHPTGDDVEAVVHAVYEVDVGAARPAIHRLVPRSRAHPRVGGGIILSQVCLGLGYLDPDEP